MKTYVAIDWAVAKREGLAVEYLNDGITRCLLQKPSGRYAPSTDWAQGGPIIEREAISIAKVGRSLGDAIAPHPECWCAHIDGAYATYGQTPLIAAMRCYVASKLGDEVEILDELKGG